MITNDKLIVAISFLQFVSRSYSHCQISIQSSSSYHHRRRRRRRRRRSSSSSSSSSSNSSSSNRSRHPLVPGCHGVSPLADESRTESAVAREPNAEETVSTALCSAESRGRKSGAETFCGLFFFSALLRQIVFIRGKTLYTFCLQAHLIAYKRPPRCQR